ncbi:hypothetical protein JXA31_03065 [Candidatus Bathyarchaeota archaeon]|nr:hypothetical protein [Candidatus Bathyarchaeota archaeon]
MNRKIIATSFVLMTIVILAVPLVSAKPTSAANNPNSVSFVWHSENGGHIGEDVVKTNPPWAGPEEIIVTHTQATWGLNDIFNNYVQIGDDDPITIYAEDYEGSLYVQTVTKSPGVGALNYRVYEKVMWGEGNYIEIMCLERASYDENGFYASGTFSGHGVIDGQKVQVTGVREGYVNPMIGFVLDCYGTIRFAGNMP